MESAKNIAINLLELIQADGFTFKRVASTHGGEYAGPCPWCGGNDRFLIWPQYKGGRYWCRGCEKTGDTIQYLRDSRGLSFAEACQKLGISKAGYKRKRSKPAPEKPTFKPKQYEPPPELWIQKAAAFLKFTQEKLWAPEGRAALDFLHGKGLTGATIRRGGIGFNPLDLYRDRQGWGLPREIRFDGKQKLVWIPAGIVIPLTPLLQHKEQAQSKEGVARLRVRRNDPGADPRYVIVAGSTMAPLVLEPDKNIFVIVESELDALLLWQEAADLTGIMAMGAAGMKPDAFSHSLLIKSEKILIGLDYDPAGARYAQKFWPETYGQKVKRWPVPFGKDPSDAWQQGLNIREWIEAGIE